MTSKEALATARAPAKGSAAKILPGGEPHAEYPFLMESYLVVLGKSRQGDAAEKRVHNLISMHFTRNNTKNNFIIYHYKLYTHYYF
ncbi:hypothetical protein DWUX_2262 [Desulfovibrio diazotrophicus]|nr:hypothetical protein DWUX_2262 [Desulfovibrio diazotrophicus]